MASNRKSYSAKYQKVPSDDDKYSRFKPSMKPEVPYRAIGLAVFLFVGGTCLITLGSLLLTGHIIPQEYADRTWPLLMLGCLMFIPGAYHVHIAYCAFRGYHGYSFNDIPEFQSS